jgi:hypothetical protein
MKPYIFVLAVLLAFIQVSIAADVKLAWDPNTQPELAGYKLSYGASSGQYGTTVDVGNVTTYTVSGLTSGTYYFAVRAYGSAGQTSAYSNEVSATVSPSDTTPPTISSVSASSITASGATITWTTNESSDSLVQYGTTTSYGSNASNATKVTAHSVALSGLISAATYHYKVCSTDSAGNTGCSGDFTFITSAPADITKPTVTAFSIPSTASGLTVSITSFTATDNVAVTGYMVTESSTAPSAGTSGWSATAPASYTSASEGSKTLYAWAKDTAGNVSTGVSDSVTITLPDTTKPTVNTFSIPSTAASLTVAITSFTASDNKAVTGYLVTESSTAPLAGATGWSATAPASYTFASEGSKTLYAWAKDAAGNVSTGASDSVTITLPDTMKPTVNTFSIPSTAASLTVAITSFTASDNKAVTGYLVTESSTAPLAGAAGWSAAAPASYTFASEGTKTLYAWAKDGAGNVSVSRSASVTITLSDTTPPVISSVASTGITTSEATITWTTNEEADSQIGYKTSSQTVDSTAKNTAMVTAHSLTLSGLTAGTRYYYSVTSTDAAGNQAVLSGYSFTTNASADTTSGLVAAYGFNEGTGNTSADLSGNGNTATIYSASWTTGKYGKALYFNGKKAYVSAATNALPGVNEPKTVAAWIYQNNLTSASQSIVSLGNPAAQSGLEHGVKAYKTGVLDYDNMWLVTANSPRAKQWHHFAYVFDGSQNRLYIDGNQAGSSTIAPEASPTTVFEIGRWFNGSEYFKGSIDELRVYNRALSQDEIKAAMAISLAEEVAVTQASAASGTSQEVAAMVATEDAVVEEAVTEEAAAIQDPGLPTVSDVSVNAHLERQAYRPGQTVKADSFWISNPSQQKLKVELKTWLELPGISPISIGNVSTDEVLALAPEFNQDYGEIQLFKVSKNSPSGTCEFNARLLDPATGDILSEDINSFSIRGSASSKTPGTAPTPNVVLEVSATESGYQYIITNKGTETATVELKVWIEASEGNRIPVYSLGANGSLVLPAGADVTLDPLSSFQISSGTYLVKSRILAQVTGQVLFEGVNDLILH